MLCVRSCCHENSSQADIQIITKFCHLFTPSFTLCKGNRIHNSWWAQKWRLHTFFFASVQIVKSLQLSHGKSKEHESIRCQMPLADSSPCLSYDVNEVRSPQGFFCAFSSQPRYGAWLKADPMLRELAHRGQREPGGGIHAT